MKDKKKLFQTREQKLLGILEDMNSGRAVNSSEKLICETPINMARIRAYSDLMYILKQRPLQTACYYGAVFFFLTLCAAVWTKEWVLAVIFAAVTGVLATAPHNMRIHYFNKSADALEQYYGKILNVEFADNALIVRETPAPVYKKRRLEDDEENAEEAENIENAPDPEEEAEEAPPAEPETIAELSYKHMTAVECSHSFYIFPAKSEAIICDKTLFLRGTPMGARDFLARKIGKKLKIKTKVK